MNTKYAIMNLENIVLEGKLNRLKEKALHVKIDADIYVLVSKSGFSNEVSTLDGTGTNGDSSYVRAEASCFIATASR